MSNKKDTSELSKEKCMWCNKKSRLKDSVYCEDCEPKPKTKIQNWEKEFDKFEKKWLGWTYGIPYGIRKHIKSHISNLIKEKQKEVVEEVLGEIERMMKNLPYEERTIAQSRLNLGYKIALRKLKLALKNKYNL